MKKICSMMVLCATILLASCQKDDEATIGVSEVKLDKTELSLEVNTSGTLVATVLPDDAENATVTWSSSDKTVATVSEAGVVSALKVGETTITASAGDKAATCKVTVTEKTYIEVNGIKVAVGNLVADGANNAKIGAATDNGLFFQFGSLIGWSETGDAAIVVQPTEYTGGTSWDISWTGDPATINAQTGTGDPCKYYLKGGWRLPTGDEYKALFNNTTTGWAGTGGWSWTAGSATNTGGLTLPAAGMRESASGGITLSGMVGPYWSSSIEGDDGKCLSFSEYGVTPGASGYGQFLGLPVRCVQVSN